MAVKVNLLPPEYAVPSGLNKVLGITRMLGVIALAAFLIFGLGLGTFFVISQLQLNNLNNANTALKSQLLSQQTAETQVVLLKDRVKKIKTAQNTPSSIKNLTNANPFLANLGGSSSITELDVDSKIVAATVNFRSNSDMSSFIKSLTGSTVFKTILISSFGFNPASGYLMTVNMAN